MKQTAERNMAYTHEKSTEKKLEKNLFKAII